MQTRSEEKRQRIRQAAARLFAERPYHEVRLSEVAAAAGVGKGTIYVYFRNKDALYLSVHLEDFSNLVERLEKEVEEDSDPDRALERIVRGLVGHLFQNPHVFEVIRTVGQPTSHPPFRALYARLVALIERVVRTGIEAGRFEDEWPNLTAVYVPGLVRSAVLYGASSIRAEDAATHLLHFLEAALARR